MKSKMRRRKALAERMGEEKTYTEFMWRNPKKKEHLKVLDTDGRTISKKYFKLDGKT